MSPETVASIRPQPLIAVADVERSSAWYQLVLGATSDHGGPEYERLLVDGELVLQLHQIDTDHHHTRIGDSARLLGNGVALWFEAGDFDSLVQRVRRAEAEIEADVHVNPNARHREIWIRDLDGYLVVFSERPRNR
jgi:catechol 2,3-dioxygenase-like lactoylglutathione lyase family enzyme